MTDDQRELFLDLLTAKAIYGLDDKDQQKLDELDPGVAEVELHSLEMAAAAISLIDVATDEPMPSSLLLKIKSDAQRFVGDAGASDTNPWPPVVKVEYDRPHGSAAWFSWLGWAVAAVFVVAFGINFYISRPQPDETARNHSPVETPLPQSMAEKREAMLRSSPSVIKGSWAAGNVKDLKQVSGDVVWSDAKQAGFMRFRGLPVNDPSKETYQLWIFDKTQDKATPIDGGTFDVSSEGEIIVPVNAKLRAEDPSMFAVTIEKPGGVVVSKRDKIAALAKVETGTS